jgi:CP family cyanate transporter-like MFS transporter
MTDAPRSAPSAARVLVGVLAAAFTLRLGIVTVGPLIERIREDTGMSSTVAGMLTMIPFLCMGVFAFPGIPLIRRMGARRLVGAALVLMGLGGIGRAVVPDPVLIVLASVPLGIGMALAGMALPVVVKRHFAERPGAATGGYVAALSIGAACGALLMVPIADSFGSWRWGLVLASLPSLVAIPFWFLVPSDRHDRAQAPTGVPRRAGLRPPRHAVPIAVVFATQSMCFAAVISWVAALYVDHGWSEGTASWATAVVPIVTIPASLIVPAASDRGDRRRWITGSAVAMTGGLLGLAFAPTAAPWLWIVTFAAGSGSIFPLALTLPLDLARGPDAIARLSAWVLGIGYVASAVAPVLVGALRDATGGFTISFAILAALSATTGIAGLTPALRRTARTPATAAAPLPAQLP